MTVGTIRQELPILETERLLLRALTLHDATDIFSYAADPQVARYTSWQPHRSLEESRTFLQSILNRIASGTAVTWGVLHKGQDHVIGTCGLSDWDRTNAHARIGIALARTAWNHGYASEAMHAVMTYGFLRMNLTSINAHCHSDNHPAIHIVQDLQMEPKGGDVYEVLREMWG